MYKCLDEYFAIEIHFISVQCRGLYCTVLNEKCIRPTYYIGLSSTGLYCTVFSRLVCAIKRTECAGRGHFLFPIISDREVCTHGMAAEEIETFSIQECDQCIRMNAGNRNFLFVRRRGIPV